jgi:hypothetical protein
MPISVTSTSPAAAGLSQPGPQPGGHLLQRGRLRWLRHVHRRPAGPGDLVVERGDGRLLPGGRDSRRNLQQVGVGVGEPGDGHLAGPPGRDRIVCC